jgi:hypothetical protein
MGSFIGGNASITDLAAAIGPRMITLCCTFTFSAAQLYFNDSFTGSEFRTHIRYLYPLEDGKVFLSTRDCSPYPASYHIENT